MYYDLDTLQELSGELGFRGTNWHSHGILMLIRRDGAYVEFDELDIVQSLKDWNIVILEMYITGELRDRWLAHREEKPDVQHITPGEEIRCNNPDSI